ncbi:alpha/beta fold hydrolase [Bacillus sp. ISL-47]|uniref:alpha/beta fold hydrolase n=1 Tax=Bacillus sp. ISL-47 TaxID=2819130 RepID=UPI001BE7C551|nr:alpha/beta fold hydrolase [Bacillus sp. ISL-47]MBT2687590.1 alpha/beta fold hydrolase [Bacillus sp. ISL-47]MBT2706413.1 alpha/beta fold hydrolase [Pseudomonas sp. ISL-84]
MAENPLSKKLQGFFKTIKQPEPETGFTPRTAVWKKNKAVLWHYAPAEKNYKVPVFLVYSLVNQAFILDLGPQNSLIEALTNSGYDVYLLDFGIPGYEDKDITMDDYIVQYIQKGVRRTLSHSRAEELTVMGFCLGGTFAAIYAAIAEEPVKNLILSVAPIDFSHVPVFDQWAEELRETGADLDSILDAWGLIPAPAIKTGMRLVTSPVYYSPYLSLLSRADNEEYAKRWKRFNHWTNGHIPFAGAALKQILHDLGKENKLVKGSLVIDGKKAALGNINANLLAVASSFDRLVPKEQLLPVMNLVSSKDKQFHLLKGGHANLTSDGKVPYYMNDWLSVRSGQIK